MYRAVFSQSRIHWANRLKFLVYTQQHFNRCMQVVASACACPHVEFGPWPVTFIFVPSVNCASEYLFTYFILRDLYYSPIGKCEAPFLFKGIVSQDEYFFNAYNK